MFGGRVDDVAGVPGDPSILYVAHSTGGFWKSINGGTTFHSVFNDGNTLSVGAVAIAPDNPNVVYIGTGEGIPRNSISFGDGIYKSTDGASALDLDSLPAFHSIQFSEPKSISGRTVLPEAAFHSYGPTHRRSRCDLRSEVISEAVHPIPCLPGRAAPALPIPYVVRRILIEPAHLGVLNTFTRKPPIRDAAAETNCAEYNYCAVFRHPEVFLSRFQPETRTKCVAIWRSRTFVGHRFVRLG